MPDLLDRLQRLASWRPSRRRQRQFMVVATAVFLVGSWLSLRSLGVGLATIRWWPIVAAGVVGVPLTLVANTGEYLLSVRLVGQRTSARDALRLTVVATAANLLPVPGAFLVRAQGLHGLGAGYRRAASATVVVGIVWIAVSALLAGGVLVASATSPWVGWAMLLGGVLLLSVSIVLLGRRARSRRHHVGLVAAAVGIELFAVASNALRLVLVLVGIGVDAELGQAFVLAVSSSLSSATGLLPGGFGIREAIAAGLSPLVALPASAGFAGTAVNRVVGMIAMAPVSLVLAVGSDDASEAPLTSEEARP